MARRAAHTIELPPVARPPYNYLTISYVLSERARFIHSHCSSRLGNKDQVFYTAVTMSPKPGLSEMPPELLLHVASFLRPRLEEAKTARVPRLALGKLQKSRAALFNYSNTCRGFKHVLDPEVYHTVVIGKLYNQEWNEAIAFLDILGRRPVVRGWVKELFLVLYPSDGRSNLSPSQTSLLGRLAMEAQMRVPEESQTPSQAGYRVVAMSVMVRMFPSIDDESRLAVLASVLVRLLRSIRILSFSSSATVTNAMNTLLRVSNPSPEANRWPEVAAPASFGLYDDVEIRKPFGKTRIGLSFLTGMAQGASDLSIQGLDITLPPRNELPALEFATTTSLCLENLCLETSKLRDLLLLFPNLATFKYFFQRDGYSMATPPNPITLLDALRSSHPRQGLRTLCVGLNSGTPPAKQSSYDTFCDFRGLENLWISSGDIHTTYHHVWDGMSVVPGEETFLRTLPSSLKRLHVAGWHRNVLHDMRWLARNCRGQGLDRLNEVAFGEESPVKWRRTPYAFEEAFARIGVRSSRDVGNPDLW